MSKRVRFVLIAISAVAASAWAARAQGPASVGAGTRKPTAASPSVPPVAVVGGVPITRATFEQRFKEAEHQYLGRSTAPLPAEFRPAMRRQVLEGMMREQLLILEARRRGMVLTPEQAEEELKKDPFFLNNGLFDEAKFLAIKSAQPEQFRTAVAEIQRSLPARRLKDQLDRQSAPDEKALRAEIERKLSSATIDYLALHRAAFSGDDPEPSEREVLAYYRAHAADFQRPEQVRLSILPVNQPPLADSLRANEGAVRAWEAVMAQRADSLLAALKRGARLEKVARGGIRQDVLVERGRFPGYWRGGARTRDAVFTTPPGSVLPEAVQAEPGRLIVRVEEHLPAHTAPVQEVSASIRATMRADQAAHRVERELQAIYAAVRDSLRGTAYRIRYAVADTGTIAVPQPTATELDRYYRGHQADYTHFDRATSSVIAKPFAEVVDDVRVRLLRERRRGAARDAAARLAELWGQGRRDPRLERTLAPLREVGPIPAGGAVDTGLAGITLTDSLASRSGMGAGLIRFPRGWVTYHVFGDVKDYSPSFEQCRPLLVQRREPLRQASDEAGARKLFEERPELFKSRGVLRFSRLMIEAPSVLEIPLTHEEVQAWYRSHISQYGAPELAHVRHILVSPRDASPEADREARARAEALLGRVKADEDFAALAREHSDDEATKSVGGDVGVFRRGMMLDEFERVAFAMEPSEIRGPVKTEVGYHIMECLEHVPAEVVPLKYCYGNVGQDAAREKGRLIARFRADSLWRTFKTVTQARATAARTGYSLFQNDYVIGTPMSVQELRPYFARLETMKAGQIYPGFQEYRGMGFAVTWIDSVLPPQAATWEQSKQQALAVYRGEADKRKMLAKRAELDSLLRAGWSFDSLAALRGGFERHGPEGPGSALARLGGAGLLDSLVFGAGGKPPVLEPGKETDWIEFPGGFARLRLLSHLGPDPVQLASRLENERRLAIERGLRAAFDKLQQRFPVQIVDHDLKITELPPLDPS